MSSGFIRHCAGVTTERQQTEIDNINRDITHMQQLQSDNRTFRFDRIDRIARAYTRLQEVANG